MGRTKPVSIRFDPEKLELIKRREKLLTPQKVVDFLMDNYWWQNRLITTPAMTAAAQNLPYITLDQPKTAIEAYEQKIRDAMSAAEIEQIGKLLEVDPFVKKDERVAIMDKATKKVQSLEI